VPAATMTAMSRPERPILGIWDKICRKSAGFGIDNLNIL